ncbi:phage terminase small subunit [Pseudomonas syringae]|uniref:phage terminase small subunit n=1 Tax=Pseudomonas syringae TaxID=317 RepID=UPI0003522036|nr:phage terminase small subunit [Pseudomonas syringae]EPF66035.1 Prophage PssSM-01, putative terminase, endonuclease subunit [Pseudomonas syringae pv. syringae SM]RML36806.1 Prophage PssSM-01, putative terminase, endonuclease subunit [Pseudomonas syringae pv. atrofaciens]
MSLALAHKRRVIADGPAALSAGAPMAYSADTALSSPANARKHLKLMEDALAGDLERIGAINSREHRQTLKREELLPKYLEYVQRYRDSELNFPNSVLAYVLIWLFDTEQFTQGLELADFAMSQGQALPERFNRDIPTFVADQVIDWAEAEFKARRSPEPYVSNLLPRVDGEWQLFERIPARYHKLLGLIALNRQDWPVAIAHFERAEALYESIGVGTRLNDCRRALAKVQAKENAGNGTE